MTSATLPASQDQAVDELRRIQLELRRRMWPEQPEMWVRDRLGEQLWSRQVDIFHSVRDNRRTAVRSAHEVGKSFSASRIAGWWLDTHQAGEAFVVTSAPSGPQVKAILWKEIGRVHARAGLMGRINQTEWWVRMSHGNEELVAFGRKPDDYDPTAFQGIHAPYVLVIFDEGGGIRGPLWEAADSLIANDTSKELVIGNPDDPLTEFEEICRPGSGWNVLEISAFDTPNFTGEELPDRVKMELIGRTYVEEKRRRWAPDWYWVDEAGVPCDWRVGRRVVNPPGTDPTDTNPYWQSKVLGKFPIVAGTGGLIPIHWVTRAQARSLPAEGESTLGMDVGGGGDVTTIAHDRASEQGHHVRIIHEDNNPSTMSTLGTLISFLKSTRAAVAKIDMIGIGRGVLDRAKEQKRKDIIGIDVGEAADEPDAYANLRAELWWHAREEFENDRIDIDPKDEDLAGELVELRYERQSNGRIVIEAKKAARKRKVRSPNRAEAVMLAISKARKRIRRATWGSS